MKQYEDSEYGFCDVCMKTDIPAIIETLDGLELICPTCASRDFEDAESIEDTKCSFAGCHRVMLSICIRCEDPVCSFHLTEGYCDLCKPAAQSTYGSGYGKGWTARSGQVH